MDPVTADGNTGGNFNRYWYGANNPYRFTDPDGRMIRPTHTPWGDGACPPSCKQPPSNYIKQLDMKVVGSKKFKEKVASVEEKAERAGINTFQELRDADGLTEIIESNRTRFLGGSANGRQVAQVFWNPSEGALIKISQLTGGMRLQSPALGLLHELGHAAQQILGGQAGALSEEAVIFGVETKWAKFYDEPVRDPFRAHGGITVDGKGLFDHE